MQSTKLSLKTFVAALLFGLLASFAAMRPAAADTSVIGLWQKTDEQTGAPVGWFLFVERGGYYEGAIAKTFDKPGDHPTCTRCQDRPQKRAYPRDFADQKHDAERLVLPRRQYPRSARRQYL